MSADKKIQSLTEAISTLQSWKATGLKTVFTNGCFDILHAGHVSYLEEAQSLGDKLILGLNSDRSIKNIKGEKRPIISEAHRAKLLAALACIDLVVIFEEDTPLNLIEALQPDVHVKGGDYIKEELPEYPVITGYGGTVEILPFVPGCSTSGVIERVLESYSSELIQKIEDLKDINDARDEIKKVETSGAEDWGSVKKELGL